MPKFKVKEGVGRHIAKNGKVYVGGEIFSDPIHWDKIAPDKFYRVSDDTPVTEKPDEDPVLLEASAYLAKDDQEEAPKEEMKAITPDDQEESEPEESGSYTDVSEDYPMAESLSVVVYQHTDGGFDVFQRDNLKQPLNAKRIPDAKSTIQYLKAMKKKS